jgi:ATP-dependent DNA helicase RecG
MTKKFAPAPRKLMEMAIEAMQRSVVEPRRDGKASPKVGALLLKPDGTVETACRGELRHGDHAEFTLLERKNRSNRLDGCVLFATLEPCAPGAREPPKMSCAERIVLARIKEAWVGIEDPDPTVDRKGIKYLQECGVTVHMFDRDLQETIRAHNKDFLAQAIDRAKSAEEKKPTAIALSPLEAVFAKAVLGDLSAEALKEYRARAKIRSAVGSQGFNRLMRQQGLLEEHRGGLAPTGFGFLLFGKKPRRVMHQAGLLALICYPGGAEERREFDEPLVLIPDLVEKWLKDKLPSVIDRGQTRRKERPALPYELVREGLANALIHRDYEIAGAKCQLTVTEDTVAIRSPGRPPEPITIEQLQSFTAPMLSRNPSLHYVFGQMDLAEEQGLGIRSMKTGAEELRLPLPRYTWDDPYLVLTLYRSPEAVVQAMGRETLESLSKAEQKGWQWIAAREVVTSRSYSEAMGIPNRTALNHLKRFTRIGLLRRSGTGPATRYEVRSPTRQ